jgi:4-amino-4-deoxy-L-arabinose transferase-like glycosyltransferase
VAETALTGGGPATDRLSPGTPALRLAVSVLCALALFSAALPLYRSQFLIDLNINEGWNAYFADAARNGTALYPSPDQLITNNYPPLSFYLVAALTGLFGNPVFAGRALAFAAVSVVTVAVYGMLRTLAVGRLFALAAAASYFGVMCRLFSKHAAIDDPQLLAEAVASVGFLWFLRELHGGRRFLGPAAVMVCAVFFKQTVLAFPFTAFVVLWPEDRPAAIRFGASGTALALAGLVLCRWQFGSEFLFNLFAKRPYQWSLALRAIEDFHRIAAPVVAWGLYAAQGPDGRRGRMINVLCAAALLESLVLRGAKQVDYNAGFEFVIAVHLALGVALQRLPYFGLASRYDPDRLRMALVAGCALRLLIAEFTEKDKVLSPAYREQLHRAERITRDETARVASLPGPVFCASTLVCYLAGKPFVVDPINVELRLEMGGLPADILARKVASGELLVAPIVPGALGRR